jgi:hypothetical protein
LSDDHHQRYSADEMAAWLYQVLHHKPLVVWSVYAAEHLHFICRTIYGFKPSKRFVRLLKLELAAKASRCPR